MAAAPAEPQTAMPISDIASMANNLPRKMESTGTAAAMISITLFDFSSISCDSSMPASRMVRMNSTAWPMRAVTARAETMDPAEWSVSLTISGAPCGTGAMAARRASSSIQCSWRTVRPSSCTAPVKRGALRPPSSTPSTGGFVCSSRAVLCLLGIRRRFGMGELDDRHVGQQPGQPVA